MKKIILPLAITFLYTACSKQQTQEEMTSMKVMGNYTGEAACWGPGTCTKIEGGARIKVMAAGPKEISIIPLQNGDLPFFVPFPAVKATLICLKEKVYYYTVTPITTSEYKVWETDTRTANGVNYNIAFFPDGRIDARMGFYDFKITQANQHFDYTGNISF